MRTTQYMGLSLPETQDDVLVEVLDAAFEKIDLLYPLVSGDGISVGTDASTGRNKITFAPAQTVSGSATTVAPSSKAVADYVQAQVSGSGTYQGQVTYYGTKAQITSVSGAKSGEVGIYLESNNLYRITRGASSWGSGVVESSQASGNSYDVQNLLDYPATGGGYESGQIRLVVSGSTKSVVVTGASKSVKTVVGSAGIAVSNTDPFNPVVSLSFGTVSSSNTTKAVTGKAVNDALALKQNNLVGTAGNVILFGATAGTVAGRGIQSVPVSGSNQLITSGAVYDAGLTLENQEWIISFAETEPARIEGENILWVHR